MRFADHPRALDKPVHSLVAIARNRWSRSIGIPGRDRSERLIAINWNGCSRSIGIGGRDHPARAVDRLARNTKQLLEIVETVKEKGASIQIKDLGLDTNSTTGELILTILGAVAQWERVRMLERQKEGIAKAKRDGKFKGKKPTARAKAARILELHREGVGAGEELGT